MTLDDIQEDAIPCASTLARRGKMDDNFQLGDAGAVKNVSHFFSTDYVVLHRVRAEEKHLFMLSKSSLKHISARVAMDSC